MNHYKMACCVVGALAYASGASPVRAEPLTLAFEGVLTEALDPASLEARGYDASIAVGAAFSGSFSFDPLNTPDEQPDPTLGRFPTQGTMVGYVGTVTFEVFDVLIRVYDDHTVGAGGSVDNFISAGFGGNIGGQPLHAAEFRLGGGSAALSSDALPSQLQLSDFPEIRSFALFIPDSVDGAIPIGSGAINTLSLAPEPNFIGGIAVASLVTLKRRGIRRS